MLTGNVVSIGTSAIIVVVWSLWKPDNYDFVSMGNIALVEDAKTGIKASGADSPEAIEVAYKFTRRWGSVMAFVLIILWPCLALPATIFSEGYFTFWVVLSITWGLIASVIAVVMPPFESRHLIWRVTKNFFTCHVMHNASGGLQDDEFGSTHPDGSMVAPKGVTISKPADPQAFKVMDNDDTAHNAMPVNKPV